MQCINEIFALFEGSTRCPAIALSAASVIVGAVVQLIICKVSGCKTGKKCSCSGKTAAKHENRPFEKRKPHPAPADGSVEIYVGNLSYDMTEEELRKTFEAYGKVNSARLITNRYNGKSKGFGFVQMPNRPEAEKACAELNDKDIMGRKMKCNEAKNLI